MLTKLLLGSTFAVLAATGCGKDKMQAAEPQPVQPQAVAVEDHTIPVVTESPGGDVQSGRSVIPNDGPTEMRPTNSPVPEDTEANRSPATRQQ